MATPLRDLVTVIITTSAVPSNPSTAVLEEVLQSFSHVPQLGTCPVILTFDGYNLKTNDAKESKFKSMKINEQEVERYMEYKGRACDVLRRHVGLDDSAVVSSNTEVAKFKAGPRKWAEATVVTETAPDKPTFAHMDFSQRIGFALAIREALKLVTTPYILIHQHDWTFLHSVDLVSLCNCMDENPTVKYIGFSSRRSLRRKCRPNLPTSFPQPFGDINLSPLYFWYDKPHVASTEHYRTFVYGYGRFKAGDFIEDTMGHAMLADLKSAGVSAHALFGTWTYVNPEDADKPTLRHRSGRHYRETIRMRNSKLERKLAALKLTECAHASDQDSASSDSDSDD